jgi:hypothetical protein
MDQYTNQQPMQTAQSVAVLTRELRIRIINCSLSGVLLEANASLAVGTVAALTLRIGDHEFKDDVRVIRCESIAGAGSLHHIGAELLWTALPGRHSLRLAVHQRATAASQVQPTF